MGHSLCVMAAGLLVGQIQDMTIVPNQPGCNCGSSVRSGWTPMTTLTQARTWTQSGTWALADGWTRRNSVSDFGQDRPILSRISGLFGSRPEIARHSSSWQSAGWQSTGWVQESVQGNHQGSPVQAVPGYILIPVNRSQTPEPPAVQPLPKPKVSLNEPPLLEVTTEPPPAALPNQPLNAEPASSSPSQLDFPSRNK